jgi:endonuclease/exonuclease/phosphatase family metal-dependent hydrolase
VLVRVVSWNLAYGKPGRFKTIENRRKQWALLAALAPDIALLQECRPNDLAAHAPAWMADEYTCAGLLARGSMLRASLLVRRPHTVEELAFTQLADHERGWSSELHDGVVAAADVEIAGVQFAVASVHAPATQLPLSDGVDAANRRQLGRTGLEKVWHNDLIAAILEPWVAGRRFIVGGDWNNSPLFDVNYPRRSDAAIGPSSSFFARRTSAGWHDSMRRFHAGEVPTYLDSRSAPYELDRVFIDATSYDVLVGCHALNGPAFRALSDHAPVVVDFADQSAEPSN